MSLGETVSAGRRTTSTPSISGSVAPDTTASNIACMNGDGVWWTISSVLVTLLCSSRNRSSPALLHLDGLPHRLAGAAAVAGVVVRARQPVPAPPIVGVTFELVTDRLE